MHDKIYHQKETEKQYDHYVTDIVEYLHLTVLLHLDVILQFSSQRHLIC